jgi:hypothetical protein
VTFATRRSSRRAALLAAAVTLLAGCAGPAPATSMPPTSAPSAELSPNASTTTGLPVHLQVVVPPVPGPVKPYRGQMVQQVYIVDGQISMYFELTNVGEEPVTFLNTLYDYEPTQLYTPAVRLEWKEGGNAVYTRAGRFFPSPAIVQPGQSAVYIMGGQPVTGAGTPGDLVTHIKYCPTRGMNDVPAIPLTVADLQWSADGPDAVTVTGTLREMTGTQRNKPPTIGVAFFDAGGQLVGAVVASPSGTSVPANGSRSFSISGQGVDGAAIASAKAYAFIP